MLDTDAMAELPHLLLVDDERSIREPLAQYLTKQGFRVTQVGDAEAARTRLSAYAIDLVVLDIMMPGEDGLSLCRHIRETSDIPVILLTARTEETDRIVGLELGAADYVGKPCNPRELLARVRAVLRRQDATRSATGGAVATFAGWRLDRVRREITTPGGREVALSRNEFVMLEVLMENAGRIVRREQLLERTRVSGRDANERAMDVQISRLRRKLSEDGSQELIVTIRSEGYLFDAVVDKEH